MAEAQYINHPEAARLFVQESAGKPWHWLACVGLNNVQLYARQLEYTRCIGPNGLETYTIPRNPNPNPFDVTFHGSFSKWQALHRSVLAGTAKPNFMFLSAECRDKDRVQDPYYTGSGVIFYGVDVSSAYGMFSGMAIDRTANAAAEREDKLSFVTGDTTWVRPYEYGLQAIAQNGGTPSSVGPVKSMAVVDAGAAADFVCRDCDVPGMKQILVNNGTNFYFSYDGGTTWTQVFGSGAGFAQAFGGIAFAVQATSIKRYSGLDANSGLWANWTTSTTDVSFAGLCNVAQYDARTFIVGGTNGATWQSVDGGGSWKQLRAGVAVTANYYSFRAMNYNAKLNWLVGVGTDAANAVYIQFSTDRGKTWQQIGAALAGKTWAGSSYAQVFSHGSVVYVLVDGDLYVLSCSGAAQTMAYTKLSIAGASGNITGIGALGDDFGDQIHITVWDGLAGYIMRTVDGFSSAQREILPVSITAGTIDVNPVVSCSNKYGQWLLFGFSNNIYYGRDWNSFFDSD